MIKFFRHGAQQNPVTKWVVPGSIFVIALMFVSARSAAAQSQIDYFKGAWTITLKGSENLNLEWLVVNDTKGPGLLGEVRTNGVKTSTDHWQIFGKKIFRVTMMTSGLVVEMETSGWKGDVLIFTGTASDVGNEFKVRETITKLSGNEFHALWERQEKSRKWNVFSEETCKRTLVKR